MCTVYVLHCAILVCVCVTYTSRGNLTLNPLCTALPTCWAKLIWSVPAKGIMAHHIVWYSFYLFYFYALCTSVCLYEYKALPVRELHSILPGLWLYSWSNVQCNSYTTTRLVHGPNPYLCHRNGFNATSKKVLFILYTLPTICLHEF